MFLSFDRNPVIFDPRIPSANDINWPAFTTDGEEYLLFDSKEPSVKSKLEVDRVVFWEEFLPSLAKGIRKDKL